MQLFADILLYIYIIIMIFTGAVYFRQLEKKRKESGLSPFELTMHIMIQAGMLLFAASLLIKVFSR
ncbi:hypothetical protein NST62_00810 [Ureibacillus sp. FSL K6-8385]|uniref:hypothetical protein n=1 Tax=Ureibacillus sp. FSL K6-8385 TaxID=2954684 RepID=UPI0031596E84